MKRLAPLAVLLGGLLLGSSLPGCGTEPSPDEAPAPGTADSSAVLRVMTYNVEDVRTADLQSPSHPRLQRAAAIVQHLRPDVFLLNEITYDQPGAPGYRPGEPVGQNARRFAENFLEVAQADSLESIRYHVFTAPVNTGLSSGVDLDGDGTAVTEVPPVPAAADEGGAPQTAAGRAYGGDAYGFGTYPGQYGMALFVRDGLEVLRDSVRTFRLLRWAAMPGAQVPADTVTGAPFYSDAAWARFRLSSKSHWDVPVRTPGGAVLHVLASHPTPPAFDGAARRNQHRNHDEIRLWADYLTGAGYLRDDSSRGGGLPEGAHFVVVGDQNADPDEGSTRPGAIQQLLEHPRVQAAPVPTADAAGRRAYPDLDPDDTAGWGLRVDYVLPSRTLRVRDAGLWRPPPADRAAAVSDHFPVWVDVVVPAGGSTDATSPE